MHRRHSNAVKSEEPFRSSFIASAVYTEHVPMVARGVCKHGGCKDLLITSLTVFAAYLCSLNEEALGQAFYVAHTSLPTSLVTGRFLNAVLWYLAGLCPY